MKIKYLFLFAVSLSIVACSNDSETLTFKNTAELNQLWIGEQSIKKVGGEAHSGERASVMDSVTDYGLGIVRKMSDILKTGSDKVVVKFWAKLLSPKLEGSVVVVNVGERDKPGSWHSYPISKFVTEPNKWQLVTIEHQFSPEELDQPENKFISIYVWNQLKSTFLVDDIEIEFHPED